jgi:large subunit ribosomal protein L25
MEQIALKAERRPIGGTRALRREGKIPAVIYGKEIDATPITVDAKELSKILKARGGSALIDIELEENKHMVLMKEIQRDTLKNMILHVDFQKVSMTDTVEFNLPIMLKGDSEGVKMGGILQFQKREVVAKALPQDMKDYVELDITNLGIGNSLTVADLEVDEKITILDDPNEVIVSVLAPKLDEQVEETEAPEEEGEPDADDKDKEEEQ